MKGADLLKHSREAAIVISTLALAAVVQWLLHLWQLNPISFATFFLAVVLTALYASAAAAWAALVLGGLLSWWLFLQPPEFVPWSLHSAVNLLVYALTGTVLLIIIRRLRSAEAELRGRDQAYANTQSRLRAIFNSSSEGLTFCRLIRDEHGTAVDYLVLDVNPAHAAHATVSREEMLNRPVTQIRPPVDPRWIDTAAAAVSTGKSVEFDVRNRYTGQWLNIRVSPVEGDFFCQAFIDVNDRHQLEQQRASLLEEMNHRVKNNFQMVGGLLDMQSRRSGSSEVREHLQAAARRIQVLGELHAGLANEQDTTLINFHHYLLMLTDKLRAGMSSAAGIRLEVESEQAILSTDKALPLGLLINEVVTNSIKYAFVDGRAGVITVRFSRDDASYVLVIADNGCGMPETAEKSGKGLGTRLVAALAAQVGARVVLSRQPGVRYEFHMPS